MNAYSSSSLLLLKGLGSLITHSFLWEQFLTYLAIVHKTICNSRFLYVGSVPGSLWYPRVPLGVLTAR